MAEAFKYGWPLQWGISIYEAFFFSASQSRVFGEGWKTGIGDMAASYLDLLSSIKHRGFDLDLESLAYDSRTLLTGAHRVAAQIVNDGEVRVSKREAPRERWTYSDLLNTGLSDDLVNAMLFTLIKYSQNCRYIAIFSYGSAMPSHLQAEVSRLELLRPPLTISLSAIGRRRIFECLYGMNDWWDVALADKFDYERFGNSADPHVHILIVDEKSVGPIQELKYRLRGLRLSSETERVIHGSDSLADTEYALKTLLFSTGRHFLNSSPLGSEQALSKQMQAIINSASWSADDPICFAGSSALEAYGIRSARDIDILTLPGAGISAADEDTAPFGEFPLSSDRIILDPRFHVKYANLSFISLPALALIKSGRAEEKDRQDLKLIISHSSSKVPTFIDTGAKRRSDRYRARLRFKTRLRLLMNYFPERLVDHVLRLYRRATLR
jgi:hypothetical protein